MAEYIEREYVLKCMEDSYKNAGISAEAKAKMTRWLNKAPAADVRPVVLCKDCLHYKMGVCLKIYDDGEANKDAWQERKPDDYCSYGEGRNAPTKESEEVSAVRCWLTNGVYMREES